MMRRNKQQCKTFYEGMLFKTNNDGDLIVTKYVSSQEVHIKFVETCFEDVVQMSCIKSGTVKDPLSRSVYGVGVVGEEATRINNRQIKERELWSSMLTRCYDDKYHSRFQAYVGCSVSDNFKYFPYFKEWCNQQIGFNIEGFELDKDILVKGNKIYSEDTCCFVPREINSLFVKRKKSRGNFALGVDYKKSVKKFRARCGNKYLGLFNTELEAFYAYKQAKETYIKEVANKWKDQIDPRVYNALMKYEVEITD